VEDRFCNKIHSMEEASSVTCMPTIVQKLHGKLVNHFVVIRCIVTCNAKDLHVMGKSQLC
jgi:hypothetical protein